MSEDVSPYPFEVFGQPGDAREDLEGRDVDVRKGASPARNDEVDLVGDHF